MTVNVQERARKSKEIHYPETDGKPMAETDLHRELMFHVIHTLQAFLAGVKAYVSGNLLVYFEEGNPRRSVAPDCFVVFGVEQKRRRIYKIWEEGRGPDVVFEVTSSSTRREDMVGKMGLYARLGVREYFLYDPTSDYLPQPLMGYWLDEKNVYQPFEPESGIAGEVNGGRSATPAFVSRLLGLRLALDSQGILQFYDLATGKRVLSKFEAQAEEERRRAEIEQTRANEERRRAEIEQIRANEERRRAEIEQTRADEAEAENARLRAELARLRGQ